MIFSILMLASVYSNVLVLTASSELLYVIISASFLALCHFAAYFGQYVLYLISFLSRPFKGIALFKIKLCPYFTLCFMLFLCAKE